jgi:error-prone DNA polymerase
MRYAELKARSCYSFLEGASHPHELIARAAQLEIEALALCDRGGVYGIPKAYDALKSYPQLKLITGAFIPIQTHAGSLELTLLARTRAGYAFLCRLLTQAHRDRPKNSAQLSFDALKHAWESDPRSKELFVLQSANERPDLELQSLLRSQLFLTLTLNQDGCDDERIRQAKLLCQNTGLDLVAVNDVYFHTPDQKTLQDILTSIRISTPCAQAGYQLAQNSARTLKSAQQMYSLFRGSEELIERSVWIARQCTFSPAELRYRYPSEWIPTNETAQSYLERLTWEGARSRYPQGITRAVAQQIQTELQLIKELSYADYFLTVADIVHWARSQSILCQGRGSAANSSVCFALGITAVDPVKMQLLFERFISKERGEPPDIDVDFEHERREEVIQYIYRKYGRDRAAMVSAVITYRKRSALREVSKALGVCVGTLSARKVETELLPRFPDSLRQRVNSLCAQMESLPRHLSIHSGGFTLSADPMCEIVPIEPASMPGRTIVQWDKVDLDILGLLKIDVLALGMLSTLQKTLSLTGKALHEIPADDLKTYEMIQKADTIGTFQIESRAQMSLLPRLKPQCFYDLVIEIALMRPGPIVGQMVHPYLRRRRGQEPVHYPDPRLERILGRTLGVPLFQEQVMQMAIELAGFSAGEADQLRRAIGALRSTGSVSEMGERLMKGLLRSGLSEQYAKLIYSQIQGFAEYGFPESHSASFALLAYASCYLKCHHPAEFTMSLINSQPLGFYSNHTLIDDAKRHGVCFLPVSVSASSWDCTLDPRGAIRLGARVISGCSKAQWSTLMERREELPFKSLADVVLRSGLKRSTLRSLALTGAFEEFKVQTREAFWSLLALEPYRRDLESEQLSIFSKISYETSPSRFAPQSELQKIWNDYQVSGLSVRGHPMQEVRKNFSRALAHTTRTIRDLQNGTRASLAGLCILMQRPPTARGVVFATLEDETGLLDLIFWPEVFERHKDLVRSEGVVIVSGEVQRDLDAVSFLVRQIRALS